VLLDSSAVKGANINKEFQTLKELLQNIFKRSEVRPYRDTSADALTQSFLSEKSFNSATFSRFATSTGATAPPLPPG